VCLGRIKVAAASALAVSSVLAVARPDLPPAEVATAAVTVFFACYLPLLLCAVASELRAAGRRTPHGQPGGASAPGVAREPAPPEKATSRSATRPPAPSTSATARVPAGRPHSGATT
jgi:hypothetical protein